jgi:hypothetical protein
MPDPAPAPLARRLFSIPESAEITGLSERTIARIVAQRRVTVYHPSRPRAGQKRGRGTRLDIEELLAALRHSPPAPPEPPPVRRGRPPGRRAPR